MSDHVSKFLDLVTAELSSLKETAKDKPFPDRFKVAILNTVEQMTKEETADLLAYLFMDFQAADTELEKGVQNHAKS